MRFPWEDDQPEGDKAESQQNNNPQNTDFEWQTEDTSDQQRATAALMERDDEMLSRALQEQEVVTLPL